MAIDNAEQSVVGGYQIVHTVTGGTTTAFPTSFPFGNVVTADINLLDAKWGGKGTETKGYRLAILITGKPAGSGTIIVAGIAPGGPVEQIASLAVTIGSVVETGDFRIADTIVLTSVHLDGCGIAAADSGNSRPTKVGWDNIGYWLIKFYVTSLTTTTDIKVYARIF
ncbi:hypothetical protein LCGC14_1969380 [marine sediment metagenome]|uniref:Uncharacterized protein n=1 Tax=marine sediment metagenome TaxID=412755 RepID=A0A0F9FC81_9ZZZZ